MFVCIRDADWLWCYLWEPINNSSGEPNKCHWSTMSSVWVTQHTHWHSPASPGSWTRYLWNNIHSTHILFNDRSFWSLSVIVIYVGMRATFSCQQALQLTTNSSKEMASSPPTAGTICLSSKDNPPGPGTLVSLSLFVIGASSDAISDSSSNCLLHLLDLLTHLT